MPTMPLYCEKTFLSFLGEKAICVEIIDLYFASVPELRNSVAEQIAARDTASKSGLHTLKGNLSYFGARDLVKSIEIAMRRILEENWDEVDKLHERISNDLNTLDKELEDLKERWS